MPVTAVVGAQWGDEGKGRIVDLLAGEADVVVRFQGGNNAGHTVVNERGKFALHLVPSGIFNPQAQCIIGTGVVVDPVALWQEMQELSQAGVSMERLVISERAQVVLPYHRLLDALDERRRGARKVGTTLKGIGPAYADKAARAGLQMGDLLDEDYLWARLEPLVAWKNRLLTQVFEVEPLSAEAIFEELRQVARFLAPYIRDTLPLLEEALARDRRILLEGQLGALRDLDWGTYPYVTSSNPTAGGACSGAGLPPAAITQVLGVAKAYTTAVGEGPFPTELRDETGNFLREEGGEYGATTGRPRRCGWFDAVAVRYSARLNGFTGLALTKLDVLDHLDRIRIGVAYRYGDQILDRVPMTRLMEQVEPVYEEMEGWRTSTIGVRTYEDLPPAAQAYVSRLEELIKVPIKLISVGPERHQIVFTGALARLLVG
jgi:adenylosuccinate synthase